MTDLAQWFERRTRDDGTTYTCLKDDRPQWLQDAVFEAHDDELPNDWRYETCQDICERLDDVDLDLVDTFEIADELVDIYTGDLLAWLAGGRTHYCDDAVDEYGLGEERTMDSRISLGQLHCIRQMADILLQAAIENQDEEEE